MTSDPKARTIRVEVVYALPHEQAPVTLEVEEGTTVRAAIERSGILGRNPGIELDKERVGVFGKLARLDTVLREGDRVEIYRPLKADPKEARRRRVTRRR